MRSTLNRKNLVLFFSILALGILVVLASGMREIEFDPGVPFAWNETEREPAQTSLVVGRDVNLGNKFAFWIVLLGLAGLVLLLINPKLRKRLLRLFLNIGLTLFVLNYIYENQLLSLPSFENAAGQNNGQLEANAGEAALVPVFVAPDDSSALSYIITFGLLLVVLLSAWFLIRLWMRLRASSGIPSSLTNLAAIARRSLKDISSGRDWEGVIQECYARMSDTVGDNRGIQRDYAMTTGEFAVRLERAGLPSKSVQQLTSLFDAVRYGAHKANKNDIDSATACLKDILHACGETA